ncbi:MAG TPA: phosphate ABC transporter substrate-binding protein PstS [Thermoanaerobaculia bacterium]|nr:phosphate ABC transporter substrate-binding protein PstS [Thermoanaerobaculia bacterium]
MSYTLPASAQTVQINGAGATFPYPIYSKWFDEYHKAHPNAEINYQSIGSGGGIRQLSAGTVFFGPSDGPMTNEQILAAGFRVMHLPTVLGGVVPVYNVAGLSTQLKFTGPVLADIFLGKITKWNDARLVQESPRDLRRSRILADFIKWALTDGQKFTTTLGYAPLPKEVVALELEALKRVKQ